jgi:outer membrane protein assembly factor BamB
MIGIILLKFLSKINKKGGTLKPNIIIWVVFLIILVSTVFSQDQQNWPHWRGPNHNGISKATNLPTTWSTTNSIVWKTELPWWGASTPIIWDDKIFVITPSAPDSDDDGDRKAHNPGGSELILLTISKENGNILWQQQLDNKNQLHRKANDASPSPVTDGNHVWVVTGTGKIIAFDMEGNRIWTRDLQEDYGSFGHNWGYASSPLLYKGSLFIEVLHGSHTDDPSYIISLDASNGETQWYHERPTDAVAESPDAYTTPLLLNYNDKTEIIISGGDYVTGHDPTTGKEIWRAAGLNPRNRGNYRVVGSPITKDGIIYAPTRKKPLLALKAGGIGDITESHLLWKWEDSGAPDVPSPLCDGKYFYMVDDKGRITCLDAKKGTLIWGPNPTTGGIVSTSPILAEGKIYIINEEGKTAVVQVGKEFKLFATNELDGSYTLSSPVLSDSRLYIRTAIYLYCIDNMSK